MFNSQIVHKFLKNIRSGIIRILIAKFPSLIDVLKPMFADFTTTAHTFDNAPWEQGLIFFFYYNSQVEYDSVDEDQNYSE